jgi:hypothetical protein
MKKLFTTAAIAFAMLFSYNVAACEEIKKPETKRVCVMQKDARTGVEKEVCRTIKIHQKLEGTKVPDNNR